MASNCCSHSDNRAVFCTLSHMRLNDHQTKRYIGSDKYILTGIKEWLDYNDILKFNREDSLEA